MKKFSTILWCVLIRVKRYPRVRAMIHDCISRLRMTDPKPSDISDSGVSASSSLSVSLIQAIINLGIFTVVVN